MTTAPPPLFTRRFFTMCGFTFTVFLSAFQLLPTAPFRIIDQGGSTFAAGRQGVQPLLLRGLLAQRCVS